MTMATPATMSPIRTDVTSTRAGRLSVESKCEKDKILYVQLCQKALLY